MNPEDNSADRSRFSRRLFLMTSGGVALGLGLGQVPGPAYAADALPPLPWTAYYPKNPLNVKAIRELGYCLYFKEGGCGHASFQAVVDSLAATLALDNPALNPWAMLPRGLFKYAGGGVVGWGTICGTLNGTLAAMDLLGVHNQLGNSLVDYYCTADLPTRALVGYVPPAGVQAPLSTMTSSISHSPLCHNSMSIWAAAAGVPVSDPSNRDRDAKLVGDIAARTAELLNDHFLIGINPPAWQPAAAYADCYTCHTQPDMVPSEQGKMECQTCHSVSPGHGFRRKRNGRDGRR